MLTNPYPIYSHINYDNISSVFRVEELSLPPASSGFLLSLLFDPEDGGNRFLQNVRLSPNDTAL
jgi:hypothetical protein